MLASDGAYGASNTLSTSRMQDQLELAGRLVDKHLQVDGRFPQLVDQLRISPQGVPEVSGLHDYDYPNLAAIGPGLETLPEISPVKKIPLPAELVEQFAHMQCNCTMGLFPGIGRAWLTIDSSIFVWTYEDGGDLAYFDGLGETIFGVGLLKPKPGIFQRHIRYLLCLTTPMEIVLLGVSFSKAFDDSASDIGKSEMHLLPEPLFSLSSDNTYMLTIMGMDNGRIFMGGKDGCLYELLYQAEEGWFSHRCRKINHSTSSLSFLVPSFLYFGLAEEDSIVQIAIDSTRNVLYTRTEKGTLTVYDLGVDGTTTTKVTSMNQSVIVQNAMNIARTIDRSNFHPIVHISAMEATESAHIYLVAVTHTGVRLYFTTISLINPVSRPSTLQLLHVRLPTGFSAVSPPMRPSKVHMVYHKKGILLMASSHTEESDLLWCLSNDSFSFQHQLMETQTTVHIDGKTWAMAEMPHAMHVVVAPNIQPPLIVTQHRDHPRKFVLLSAQGSQIITKLRPVDQLRHLLLEYNGPECEPVRAFFALHQDDQACEMCLILACSSSMQDKQVADWATRAFFLYGGEPQLRLPQTYPDWNSTTPAHFSTFASPISGFQPSQASTPNPLYQTSPQTSLQQSLYPQLPNTMGLAVSSPTRSQVSPMDTQNVMPGPDIHFSGKHNGLYLYMSRIVRPLWEERLVIEVPCQTPKGTSLYLGSAFTSEELSYYIEQLKGLKDFLKSHSNIMLPLLSENLTAVQNLPQRLGSILGSGDQTLPSQQQQIQTKLNVEAQLQEKSSIYNLQQLTDRTIEMLGLWRILYDHQFHIITSSLSKDYQNQLRSMTFKDLIITGQQLASVMIANLINRYLGDNATTDAVSARLREVCPTIYKEEDATFSKANELLLQSQKASNKYEKERLIKEAIQLCQHVVPRVNMPIICHQLQAAHCYDGIVDLCLLAAARRDPQNLALYYYRNGEKPEDHQGHEAFRNRMEAYKFITDSLTHLMVSGLGHPHSSSIPRAPGPPSPPSVLNPELASEWFDKCLKLCLRSEDEMFHIALYNWLLDHRLEDKLLEIKSPYVESYLVFATSQYTDNVALIDLLWKYYERNNNYGAAAKILAKLADKHGTDISMSKRLEYLSRAIVCMKSAEVLPGSRVEGEFLHELEEKMEVARIQSQILDALMQLNVRGTQDAISRLNSDLLDLTQLYEEFAFPFHLHECQLAILHCASLHDPALVETLWQNIIDKELEDPSGGASPETRISTLTNKLKSLGKIYALSQKYFPLPFLIKYLETKSIALKLDPKWVFSTLQAIGIPLSKILEMYNKFYKAKDQQWLPINKSLHLLKVLSQIVAVFANCPSLVPSNERRQFITICLDGISSYLVDLQSLDGTNPNVRIIIDSLRSTQIQLERLL